MNIQENKSNSSLMQMEELCRAANLSRSTVYQYLRAGILHPPIKEGPTKARYDETHLKQLEKIKQLRKNKKLSIQKIQKILDVKAPQKVNTSDASNDLRNLIFEKAIELFSKNGLEKTKISDITTALNLGKGTIYLYFKSKEALFLECIERFPEIILPPQAWEEIRKEPDYFRRTAKRTQFMVDAFPTFLGIINIAKSALTSGDPVMAKKAMYCFQTIFQALARDVNRAKKSGIVREIDQDFYAFLALGIGESLGYWLIMNPEEVPEQRVNDTIDIISYGIKKNSGNALEKQNNNARAGAARDLNNFEIMLQEIMFDEKPYIEGRMGEGKLKIDLETIGEIKVKSENPETAALITMATGEVIKIHVCDSVILSGESLFGKYTIPITKLDKITMGSARNDEKLTSSDPAQ